MAHLHLWAFLQGIGHYPGGWRDPGATPRAVFDIEYYRRIGQLIERGRFDAIVFGDQLQGRGANGHTPSRLAIPTLDPMTLLSAIAAVTEHVGLVATVSTTYNEPDALADRFATLDRLSNGRAGWNIVTTAHPNSPMNFGETELLEKSLRYQRAQAFTDAAARFWDAATAGEDGSTAVATHDDWFDFDGALDMPRVPQGRPVLVQAGQSPDGRDFAARTAEAIFCPAPTIEAGQAYRNDMRERVRKAGRDPDGVKIMPGLAIILGATEAEAQAKQARLIELANVGLCVEYLSESIGYDLTVHDPKQPIPLDAILAICEFPVADVQRMFASAVEAGTSLGDFCVGYADKPRGHGIFCGTPVQLADHMEAWIDAGACDGFTLQPAFMPTELELFCQHVVPILQERGLLRQDYQGPMLRDHILGAREYA